MISTRYKEPTTTNHRRASNMHTVAITYKISGVKNPHTAFKLKPLPPEKADALIDEISAYLRCEHPELF